ncbi:hypothetical protein LCL95_00765 [Bacillus timonensis]|nr:hypothetical protein [Bacillus timonensis]
MKKIYLLLCGCFTLLFLQACSAQSSLILIESSVEITSDSTKLGSYTITTGDDKGKKLVPTALFYQFKIANTGFKTLGDHGDKGISIKLEPKPSLIQATKQTIGFNIFNPDDYKQSGVGHGQSISTMIPPNSEGDYVLFFELGVSEENPDIPLLVSPQEQLIKLQDEAYQAYLIILIDGKEVKRIDLSELTTK